MEWKLPGRKKAMRSEGIAGVSLEELAEPFQESRGRPFQTWQNQRFQRKLAAKTRGRLRKAEKQRYSQVKSPKNQSPEAVMKFRAEYWAGQANRSFYDADRAGILADHLGAMADRYNEQDFKRPGLARLEAMRDAMRESAVLNRMAAEEKAVGFAAQAKGAMLGGETAVQAEMNAQSAGNSSPEGALGLLAAGHEARAAQRDTHSLLYDNATEQAARTFEQLARRQFGDIVGEPHRPGAPSTWRMEQLANAAAADIGLRRNQDARAAVSALTTDAPTPSAAPPTALRPAAEASPAPHPRAIVGAAPVTKLLASLGVFDTKSHGPAPGKESKPQTTAKRDYPSQRAAAANKAVGLPTHPSVGAGTPPTKSPGTHKAAELGKG